MSEVTKKSDEQKGAEAEVDGFRKDLGPFVVAAETTRMAMVFTDAKVLGNPIIFANDSFLSLTGYDRNELLGKSWNYLMADGVPSQAVAQLVAAFDGRTDTDPEICCRRKDGSEFWATVFINPVRDQRGIVVQHFISLLDVSKHIEAQAQAKVLIDELNHRVMNTLSTVQSIVAQAFRMRSETAVIREAIEDRLFALSRSHDLLTREHWESVGLVDVVTVALEPFGVVDGRANRVVITGEPIRVSPKATLALGIALHELATNAVKYGAFSNDTGSILIAWAIEPKLDGDRLVLHWREIGGPPVSPPSAKGFGSQVIERGLPHELEGAVRMDYQPDGLVCTINIPAPRVARGR